MLFNRCVSPQGKKDVDLYYASPFVLDSGAFSVVLPSSALQFSWMRYRAAFLRQAERIKRNLKSAEITRAIANGIPKFQKEENNRLLQ